MSERAVSARVPRSVGVGATYDVATLLLAGLLTASAGTHLPVIPEHLDAARYMGVLFVDYSFAALALAAGLLLRPARWMVALSALLPAAAVGVYVLSRVVALPQIEDDVGNWADPWGVASITVESLAVIAAALAWRASRASHDR